MMVVGAGMAMATAQFPDFLHYKGKKYAMICNPLQPFFEKYPDKKPGGGVMSTANWRGYIATFKIENQRLYLSDVTIEVRDETREHKYKDKTVLREIFPGKKDVVAKWFDGLLVIPTGKMTRYVHMGYASTYEKYLLIRVQDGEVIKERSYNQEEYQDFKKRQFEAFKKTKAYRALLKELKKEDSPDDLEGMADFLFMYDTKFTSKILLEME
jgi:hypothetical protein